MLAEFGFLSLLFLSGAFSLRALGAGATASACTGFLAGASLYILWGTLQVVSPASTSPYLTMALTVATAAGLAIWSRKELRLSRQTLTAFAAGIAIIAIAVVLFRHFHLVKWHTDSFRYISIASLIQSGNFDEVGAGFLRKRYPAISLLHAPANIYGEFYIRALSPLIAISTVSSIAWLFHASRRTLPLARYDWVALGLSLLLLVSMNRFIWNAFYLNSHLLLGALVLIIAGAGWLLNSATLSERRSLLTLQALAICAAVFSRPEGFLCAALAIAPSLLSGGLPWKTRAIPLAALGAASILIHGFLLLIYLRNGGDIQLHFIMGVVFGGACILGAPLLGWKELTRRPLLILALCEAVLWIALAIMAFRNPEILVKSLQATAHNLGGARAWGYAPIMLATLVVVAALLCREIRLSWLRFPVTASIPLYLLFAYMRDAAYRIGEGDSLNRMFIQIVPLAILYIAAAAAARDWGVRRTRISSPTTSPTDGDESQLVMK